MTILMKSQQPIILLHLLRSTVEMRVHYQHATPIDEASPYCWFCYRKHEYLGRKCTSKGQPRIPKGTCKRTKMG
ncbi:hypothetical protein PTKIN_Ptkin14bG0109700 [Pterospermum kingtungense]